MAFGEGVTWEVSTNGGRSWRDVAVRPRDHVVLHDSSLGSEARSLALEEECADVLAVSPIVALRRAPQSARRQDAHAAQGALDRA